MTITLPRWLVVVLVPAYGTHVVANYSETAAGARMLYNDVAGLFAGSGPDDGEIE